MASPRRTAISAALALLALAVILFGALSAGAATAQAAPSRTAYRAAATSLLDRSSVTIAAAGQLLNERDANPTLTSDQRWLDQYAQRSAALRAEYQQALGLRAPASDGDVQQCLTEGLRLVTTGQRFLYDGFQIDGHGAYYFSAHANWDLQLGTDRLRRCRAALVSTEVTS